MSTEDKVILSCMGQRVIFEASAPVTETRTASYDGYNIIHLPTSLMAYRNTSGRNFQITGKFVSRNAQEAEMNAHYLTLIRSWILPDFGGRGATPPIVELSAYRNININGLRCVIKSYSWNFMDDVDYIFTSIEPMPIIGTITVELDEVYSAEEITAKMWKMKNAAGGSFDSTFSIAATPSISELNAAFDGIANIAGLLTGSEIGDLTNATVGDLMSVAQNPTFAKIGNIMNSPQISQSTANIPAVAGNRNISGIAPGELSGVPTNTGISQAASQVASIGDAFGRISRSISLPIFG